LDNKIRELIKVRLEKTEEDIDTAAELLFLIISQLKGADGQNNKSRIYAAFTFFPRDSITPLRRDEALKSSIPIILPL